MGKFKIKSIIYLLKCFERRKHQKENRFIIKRTEGEDRSFR